MILGYLLAYLSHNPPLWVLGGFGTWPDRHLGAYLNRDRLGGAICSALCEVILRHKTADEVVAPTASSKGLPPGKP